LKKNFVVVTALVLGVAGLAAAQTPGTPLVKPPATAPSGPAPTKIAIINVQQAIMSTGDGRKAASEMQAKFSPRQEQLKKMQADIQGMQDQMKKGSATMSDEAKNKIARDIDSTQKSLQRDNEDFEADLQQEEGKIMQDLGQKMMDVIIKYASQNQIAVVLDVSNQQTPVLWADPSADITTEIEKLYDQAHPSAGAPAGTAKPATPPASQAKPPAVPPAKKQ
jgi:outer membrane protein